MTKVAVVGHVEWIEFVRVERVPRPGEIVHVLERWEEVGGGGAVAAVQLAKLAGEASLFTAFGGDELGRRAREALLAHGVRVEAVVRDEPQRRGFVFIDSEGERTITVIGERMGPHGDDPLGWDELAAADGVYFTAGDPATLAAARRARVVVASSRGLGDVVRASVPVDCLVGSGRDPDERYVAGTLATAPRLVVETAGREGGIYRIDDGEPVAFASAPIPQAGGAGDAYGCGDSFAAGLTFGLASRREPRDAVALAARCGAACRSGRGPYEGQLSSPEP